MMRSLTLYAAALCVFPLLSDNSASGQTELYRFPRTPGVVVFRSTDPVPAPVTSYRPLIDPGYGVPTTTNYEPAPPVPAETTVYLPVAPAVTATEWTPVEPSGGVTAYMPVAPATAAYEVPTTTYYAPQPVPTTVYYPPTSVPTNAAGAVAYPATVTYQPVVTGPAATGQLPPAMAIPVGPQVTVRPKVYIQGQPIRNFFRAITP